MFQLSLISLSLAHREPKTDHEREIQRSLQAAAYYVSARSIDALLSSDGFCSISPSVHLLLPNLPLRESGRGHRRSLRVGRPSAHFLASTNSLIRARTMTWHPHSTRRLSCPVSHQKKLGLRTTPAFLVSRTSCFAGQSTRFNYFAAPQSTEGPYHHPQAHYIRQHIAEYQSGLLLVSQLHPLLM